MWLDVEIQRGKNSPDDCLVRGLHLGVVVVGRLAGLAGGEALVGVTRHGDGVDDDDGEVRLRMKDRSLSILDARTFPIGKSARRCPSERSSGTCLSHNDIKDVVWNGWMDYGCTIVIVVVHMHILVYISNRTSLVVATTCMSVPLLC